MTGLEIIGIILAFGFVSMIETCAIIVCVNKMIDQKMRTKCELELKTFKEEMDYLGKGLEKFSTEFLKLISDLENTKHDKSKDYFDN